MEMKAIVRTFTAILVYVMCSGVAFAVDLVVTSDTALSEGNYPYDNLMVSNGASLSIAGGSILNVVGSVTVSGNSSILIQSKNNATLVNGQWQGVGVTINAASIQVDTGSKINADGQGYAGAGCNDSGTGPGGGLANCDWGGNGGSYGGTGSGPNKISMSTYGSQFAPVDLGSSGTGSSSGVQGLWSSTGGAGGGAIRLIVSGTLTNNGAISANGNAATATYGGGGAGGSVYTTARTLAGSGIFSANGGVSNNGGGGGRITVRYMAADGYSGFNRSTVNGGTGAEMGTAVFIDDSQKYPRLLVTSNFVFNQDFVATYDAIRVSNASLIKIGGGSRLSVLNSVTVEGNSTVLALSKNSAAQVNSQWQGIGATISTGTLQVNAGSKISADGQGYAGAGCSNSAAGPGGGINNCDWGGNGGTYGGIGNGPNKASMSTYGSLFAPVDLGSGGAGSSSGVQGWGSSIGGAGGGAIRLMVSGTLTNNGVISANGNAASASFGGGGAGGSVHVISGALAGSGKFSANGGANKSGGGRVAVYYHNNSGVTESSLTASGDSTIGAQAGQPGTAVLSDSAPLFAWFKPEGELVHGTVRLEGTGIGLDAATTTVDVEITNEFRKYVLSLNHEIMLGLDWDTSNVPDGRYEVRLTFRNSNNEIISEVTRSLAVNNSAAWHTGVVTASETWGASRIHLVEGGLVIPSGVTVTLEAGTVVKALDGSRIIVEDGGVFIATAATAGSRITFTSVNDDSAGGDSSFNGTAIMPIPGSWFGIVTKGSGRFDSNYYTGLFYFLINRSGKVTGDELWDGTYVYRITGDLVVPNGVTLAIQPGAVVKFDQNVGIVVQPGGKLTAQGTVAQPIYFTSVKDDSVGGDTNSNGNMTVPAAGDWRWIYLDGATASFDHVQILYGGGSVTGSWDNSGSISTTGSTSLTFKNSIIRESFYDGIVAQGGTTANIENSIFTGIQRAIFTNCTQTYVNGCTLTNNIIGLFHHGGGGPVKIRNSIFTSNSQSGVNSGSATITTSDVWGNGSNYSGMADQTGKNGNISADPRYHNQAQGDFRLDYGSPAIDAADGTFSSLTDMMGAPRYDDPRTHNTGIATTTGAFSDMGAFEFVESATSDVDLVVSNVVGPTSAISGDSVTLTWTVTNSGSGCATGPWHDALYLVRSPDSNPVLIQADEALEGENIVLGPGQSHSASATIRVPGSIIGQHLWMVKTNVRGDIFEGTNSGNNAASSLDMVTIDLREIQVNGSSLTGRFTTAGEGHWFKLNPGAGRSITSTLVLGNSSGLVQLYIGQGYMPDQQHYDFRQQEWSSATANTMIPQTSTQAYYVAVYAGTLSGAENFTVSARALTFSLTSVSPGVVASTGSATLELSGGMLSQSATYRMIGSGGVSRTATSVFLDTPSRVYTTFSLAGLSAGSYGIQVSQGGNTVTLNNALTVQPVLPQGQIEYSLDVPTALRPGWTGTVTVNYRNTGTSDAVAPLIWVSADGADTGLIPPQCSNCSPTFSRVYETVFNSGYILGINHDGPAGVLPPGYGGSISLSMRPMVNSGTITVSANLINPAELIDWTALKESLRPPNVSVEAWEPIFANFTSSAGSTFADYNGLLAANATYLSSLGDYIYNTRELYQFELIKSGLKEISNRYRTGTFGRGSNLPYDIRIEVDRGVPDVKYADGAVRSFLNDPDHANQYVGGRGDHAALTYYPADKNWQLTEQNGLIYRFVPDSSAAGSSILEYIQDLNSNRFTLSRQGGVITGIATTNGDTVTFEYNASGRIIKTTDAVGRETIYGYDLDNEHLTNVTTQQGTVSFTYVTGQGAAREHAVQSISYPDGSHLYFEYDARGRLFRKYQDGQSKPLTYTYESTGEVIIKDADGNSTRNKPDQFGVITSVVDSLGGITSLRFDHEHRIVGLTAPLGVSLAYEYDTQGNLVQLRDALGNLQNMSFSQYGRMQTHTNSVGESIGYGYDSRYNATGITYPSGGSEQFGYDARGNLVSWTNRRGRTYTYTYNNKNLLTRKTLSGGALIDYTYNSHRNLQTVTDASGVTTFTYDAADRRTAITYQGGRSLQYAYDASGRRTSMTDNTGFKVNYLYDAMGRLVRLNDGANALITAYAYDLVGRLNRVDMGNGTYTTYAYDTAGRLQNLVNYAPNGTAESRYYYTYDALGRRIALSSPEGNLTYGYDAEGQLTSVMRPDSTVMQYKYDAAGNRLTSVVNASSTAYTVNADGQYTVAGAASYSYDADGNVTAKTEGGGAWKYTYDDENRLTAMTTPVGNWSYEYDSLGNRVAELHNGQRKEFLIDPSGMGNVAAEFNEAGLLVAHYTHGIGLASRVPAAGNSAYYHFDASGNTVRITGTAGAVENSYAYLPFGEKLASVETVPNPFTFVGQFGVRDEGNGLYYMRKRWYDPILGRFNSPDPIGTGSGDANLYRYVFNNPTSFIDPLGLEENPMSKALYDSAQTVVGVKSAVLTLAESELAKIAVTGDSSVALVSGASKVCNVAGLLISVNNLSNTYVDYQAGKKDYLDMIHDSGNVALSVVGFIGPQGAVINAVGSAADYTTQQLGKPVADWYYSTPDEDVFSDRVRFGPKRPVRMVGSQDPNSKVTVGYGDAGYVTGATSFLYTVHFENVASATAAAQKVVVTDQLHANLDWSTFELQQINFNKVTIDVPPGLQSYSTTSSVATDPNPVSVVAALNPATGVVIWTMKTIDPVTGTNSRDPFAGFLPPNDAEHRGDGYVTFRVKPKTDLLNGTAITNRASIIFDANVPIVTNETTNTIDSTRPTSSVIALPSSTTTSFNVSWGGADAGSGISSYDIYVSTDGGAFTLWLAGATSTSATYAGSAGHTYGFFGVATDNVGNRMVTPANAQTSTTAYIPGDVSGSGGTPSISDALKVLNAFSGKITLTNDEKKRADVAPLDPATGKPKGDNKVDLADVVGILGYVVGVISW